MPGMTRTPLHTCDARRIALIKPSALGDIVHALPVLTALRRRFPDSHITWILNRAYEPLLAGHPDLDAILPFERGATRKSWLHGFRTHARFLMNLRRQRFDLVIDLQGLLRTGLMTFATRAPRRVGLATSREGAAYFYTDVIPVAGVERMHAVDRYWLAAEALGAGAEPKVFRLPEPEAPRAWAGDVLSGWPRPWIALGVGARWATKRWPPEHFAALARTAQAIFGGTVVFVGGAEEGRRARSVSELLHGPSLDLTGRTTLPQLTAVLRRVDVMVANDTGPLHLAGALGTPVVAPYTCTSVRLTGPYRTPGAIETRVWCQGSRVKRCSRMDCMAELTPERLWPALLGVLRQWQSNQRSA